jgi:HK97 family phage major capsid protein
MTVDLDGPLAEIKSQVTEVMKAVEESKASNDENLKKSDVLTQGKIEKINKFISEKIEEVQKAEAAQAERIKALEAAFNRAETGGQDKQLAADRAKAFDGFLRGYKEGKQEFEILDAKMAEAKDMTTEVNPQGGYLVRPEFGDFIVSRMFETSPVRRVANVETIGSKSLVLVIDDDEAAAGWIGEGGTVSETNTPDVGELEIVAHKLYAQPKVTTEMLEDPFLDVESWLMRKVAEKFSRVENTAFVSGTGTKQPKGITSYSAWTTAGTYERSKLEQVNSGAAAALTADGLINLQNSLIEDYQSNASWLMQRDTYGSVMKLKDGNQNYLFNVSLDMNTGLPTANLLTRPVIFANDMPAIAANALSLAYGDFGVGYTIVDRLGITVLRDPYTSKGFVKYFTTKRTGGAVTNFEAIKLQKIAA